MDLKNPAHIRRAEANDIEQLMDIYNDAIAHTTATFDIDLKSYADRKAWFDAHTGKYIIFVYEEKKQIAGYVSLSRYRERAAFDNTAEISIYIRPEYQSRHIGAQLMQAVLEFAKHHKDIETVVSLITSDNARSIYLHEKFGFHYCGQIRNAGKKFGKCLHLNAYQISFIKN